jgi:hypothetical protein
MICIEHFFLLFFFVLGIDLKLTTMGGECFMTFADIVYSEWIHLAFVVGGEFGHIYKQVRTCTC